MTQVGIVGASGYSGEILIDLLARHPQVTLSVVGSRSLAGKRVYEVMPHLRGTVGNLEFTASDVEQLSAAPVDVYFLALPHGVAADFALPLVEAGKRVIDLSADFRLDTPERYKANYGHDHPAPQWLAKVPYVIPELLSQEQWQDARLIASPGCYPTSVQLPLVPLLKAGVIEAENIIISSVSGVSGAGKKATEFYSFSERWESVVAYGLPHHRHAGEIEQQLSLAAQRDVTVQFIPHLVPMKRGIESTIVAKAKGSLDDVYAAWSEAYGGRPFVISRKPGDFPETKDVHGTNRCDMCATYDPRTGNLIFNSVIDNLVKGASGQAVQIMNLCLGLPEATGLL
ncbi:MAG: N-acetyl-gamma-glutamyl-phosphate reductase [Verrucomicrobiota bacterium JB022]|nr:N-acetyl-gamma-glutamyl-phosphate reductase [Verrucomicrobiota bacterium JB022]